MLYTGTHKKEISFPLGGIGSGCIGLSGNGSFVDMEIKNAPNKGSEGQFTHFAIKAENEQKVLDARVLHTDQQPGFVGNFERDKYTGFGFGPDRGSMAGFPHFEKGEFEGEFPVAILDFSDDHFPGKVIMTAFNPLIPTNEDDSSIPAAFFEFELENTTEETLRYTLGFSCYNFYSHCNSVHQYHKKDGNHYLFLDSQEDDNTTAYGNLTMATDCKETSFQEYWFRGNWFDSAAVFWQDFCKHGSLVNRTYPSKKEGGESHKTNDLATLAASVSILPWEKRKIRFVLSWSMPYLSNTWQITHCGLDEEELKKRRDVKWKNYYATIYKTSMESALYGMTHFRRLLQETNLYRKWMYASSLPPQVLDAVAANVAVLKSPTCLRLSDGSFYGFEGVHSHEGSCEGTCTHVWSYAYAAAFLFPRLERSARKLEYTQSMQEGGGMGFRLQLPIGVGATNFRPAVDGQYGTVLRVYREFLISGDRTWLAEIWQSVKESIAYAWSDKNPDGWDANQDGILEGRQHHTLDMELFSENAWLSGMYLAGLDAGIRLANVMCDEEAIKEFTPILESGKKRLNEELFNGEYFYQKVDLQEEECLKQFKGGVCDHSMDAYQSYWNPEALEMKYQIGEGCSIDQVLGQWHADLLGLSAVFEEDKVKSALQSIYRYNYIPHMREHVNPCRVYALNEEGGLIICAYPKDKKKPIIPVPYAEETMHGFEYQAASHMIKKGLEKEGLTCIKAIRDRYDGLRRNPWNEIECGSNYARSMASYALLLVYSGFTFNMDKKQIGFLPLHKEKGTYFWALDSGFGHVCIEPMNMDIYVDYGTLSVASILCDIQQPTIVEMDGEKLAFEVINKIICLKKEVLLNAGQHILVK